LFGDIPGKYLNTIMTAKMVGTEKEYYGEPEKQMEYSLPPGKARLLTHGENIEIGIMSPRSEAAFLVRKAFDA